MTRPVAAARDSAVQSLVVIAKEPIPGKVKTRLIGKLTAEQAAELARAALTDTLRAVSAGGHRNRVLLFDGCAAQWLPEGWLHIQQTPGKLDRRLAAGFDRLPPGPAQLVGMDTPQLRPSHLGFNTSDYDACLGLADDGGYWTIGFRDPKRAREVIPGVPMSRTDTGAIQYQRMLQAGMSVQLLPELTDVDTFANAAEVALAHPQTCFARRWRQIEATGVRRGAA